MAQVMIDIAGTELTAPDKALLQHEDVCGLILFSRNYQSPQQISELCAEIREVAGKPMLIAVDHEGGRVQRFRQGFSAIPAMADIARCLPDTEQLTAARELGWLMAIEVIAVGIDISFAPVLDIDGNSEVIGDRAFADNATELTPLASAFIEGMHEAGMAATGKHFPGHGSVSADSHIAIPVDERSLEAISATDLPPFRELAQKTEGIMPAHVIYSAVDSQPAGFSEFWLQQVLRQQLGFTGMIFSDDLSMHGATVVGDMRARAEAALTAGCDMILVCNDRSAAQELLQQTLPETQPEAAQRLQRMQYTGPKIEWSALAADQRWQQARQWLSKFSA